MRQLRRLKTVKKTEQSDACHFIEYVSCKEACVHLREVRIVLKQGYMEPDRLRSFCTIVSVIQAPISIPGRPFIKKQWADNHFFMVEIIVGKPLVWITYRH